MSVVPTLFWTVLVLGMGLPRLAVAQECELEGTDTLDQAEAILNGAAELEKDESAEAAAEAQYKQAWKWVQRALKEDSSNAAAYYLAGRASIGVGEYARADSMLDRFIEMKPDCASIAEDIRIGRWKILLNEGVRAFEADDDSTALEKFEQANALREDPRSLNKAAVIHQQRGNTERAEELNRRSLEIAEGDEEFRKEFGIAEYNFAVGLRRKGQPDSARRVMQGLADREEVPGQMRERADSVLAVWGRKTEGSQESPEPSSACLAAFEEAAEVGPMEDQVSDLDPAVQACSSVEAWTAAAQAHPGAIGEDVSPETFLENRCRYSDRASGLRTTPLCQEVLE